MKKNIYIERHILIGLITSDDYLDQIRESWNPRFLESLTARKVASWCVAYYDEYGRAPGQDIEGIYFDKLRSGDIPKDQAEELEEDILPDLSEEYERSDKFNVDYLIDQTDKYFTSRSLEIHEEQVRAAREEGRIQEAEELALSYQPLQKNIDEDLQLSNPKSLTRVEKAFGEKMNPILTYPGSLGDYLNSQLTRDSFIAFLAPEKRGKSFILLDMAKRGVRQRLNVAFFQAGDMSEAQQIRRLGIHLAKKSDQEQYTGKQWEPVKDCKLNQTDECNLKIRECDVGLYGEHAPTSPEEARTGLTFEQLKELYEENTDYKACYNCKKYQNPAAQLGCAWIKKVDVGAPLQQNEAVEIFNSYFVKKKRNLMISTHANNTLSVNRMNAKLDEWYRKYGFVADLIILDYADLLTHPESDYRHRQNQIWKDLRSMSEQRHALLATATQADADSYTQGTLNLRNFSEDKRKYGHVTAMYGLNQDPQGREKDIGIMRINSLVVREGESKGQVHVLQNLKRGQPILTSYW